VSVDDREFELTVIVSVKINDGIVMAADSASTFGPITLPDGTELAQTYANANKIVNLRKDLPIGAMVTGSGNIGKESIDTLLKDLRQRFSSKDSAWTLNPDSYTVEHVSTKLREFLFEEKAKKVETPTYMRIRICGYSAGQHLPEIWEVLINGAICEPAACIQSAEAGGVMWDGEYEPLNRLVLGISGRFRELAIKQGAIASEVDGALSKIFPELSANLYLLAMPIQDAIDLARFLVEVTIGFVKFSVTARKGVGGPIEIAAITKHEGFKWIQRKHFYREKLNPNSALQ